MRVREGSQQTEAPDQRRWWDDNWAQFKEQGLA